MPVVHQGFQFGGDLLAGRDLVWPLREFNCGMNNSKSVILVGQWLKLFLMMVVYYSLSRFWLSDSSVCGFIGVNWLSTHTQRQTHSHAQARMHTHTHTHTQKTTQWVWAVPVNQSWTPSRQVRTTNSPLTILLEWLHCDIAHCILFYRRGGSSTPQGWREGGW